MSRRRFYALPEDINESGALLSVEETHHLLHVLRLKPGDEAFVFDGCGREYRCRIAKIEPRARLEIIDEMKDAVESPLRITLAQALTKGEKFDFIVQKATELGASRIVPLATDHADVRLKGEGSQKRLERWRKISLEALKQCRRRHLVEIARPVAVNDFLKTDAVELKLALSERGGLTINESLVNTRDRDVVAMVGPEGGWSAGELGLMQSRGCRFVTLGPRVLRAETAAVVAVALIQHALGDLSR
jgi:16S rRNA (uracil1498-N3)-methyltransferase